MASANLDLVRSIFAAWERGDYPASAEAAHPDLEFVITDGPSPGRWTGVGLTEGYREVLSAWEDFRFHGEEYRELDSERVLVLVHFSGRGKTSGLEVGQIRAEGATVFHVHGGKVTGIVHYWDRDRALADLGLTPETGSASWAPRTWRSRSARWTLEMGQLRSKGATVFHVRDGKVTRLVIYADRESALTDLGLVSEGDSQLS